MGDPAEKGVTILRGDCSGYYLEGLLKLPAVVRRQVLGSVLSQSEKKESLVASGLVFVEPLDNLSEPISGLYWEGFRVSTSGNANRSSTHILRPAMPPKLSG